jgi:hypothetical protein
MKSAINMAWEHGGTDFQSRFDKSTGLAAGVLRMQSTIHTCAPPRILLHEVLAESQRQETQEETGVV